MPLYVTHRTTALNTVTIDKIKCIQIKLKIKNIACEKTPHSHDKTSEHNILSTTKVTPTQKNKF